MDTAKSEIEKKTLHHYHIQSEITVILDQGWEPIDIDSSIYLPVIKKATFIYLDLFL